MEPRENCVLFLFCFDHGFRLDIDLDLVVMSDVTKAVNTAQSPH